jgi:hypothetical protein
MLENISVVYIASVAIFLIMNLWSASNAVKLSESARGKEIKQFYKRVAADSLTLTKWSPIWFVPVIKDIVALIKWRLKR